MISVKSEVEDGREEDRAGVGGGGGGDAESAVGGEDGGVPMEEGLGESPPAAAAAGQASASQDRLGPVQDTPEDLSVKKLTSMSSSSSSSSPSTLRAKQSPHSSIHAEETRSSGSPGSQGSSSGGEPSRPKRIKPIPPPLDLNARTLSPSDSLPQVLPRSPADLPRECLPLRKRAVVNVKEESELLRVQPHAASDPASRLNLLFPPPASSASAAASSSVALTPSSATLSAAAAFTHFPVPPPLIPIPGLTSPYHAAHHAAAAAAAAAKSPFLTSPSAAAGGFPTPPTDLHSPAYPWASPTALTAAMAGGLMPHAFSPLPHSPLPFPTSSLLSPSPSSYHSSSNSSREDLPASGYSALKDLPSTSQYLSLMEHKASLSVPTPRYGHVNLSERAAAVSAASGSGGPLSPAATAAVTPVSPHPLSPLTRSHAWPIPVWQCFMSGVQVRFLLPSTDTPWQKSEELGWKDKLALKVDSRNPYQYAPNGLKLVKMDYVQSEASILADTKPVLRLRMSPNNVPEVSKVDMLAECPPDHPFFVKDKGWCSARPRLTLEKFGIPCQDLMTGDVCLPPNHPEAVKTPDLCDRFKRFEFNSADLAEQLSPSPGGPRAAGGPLRHGIASLLPRGSMMSPPMSPAKAKKMSDPDKPKRPMNGFMLFAKKYRLELIQQHPGKDNRAISVLLGEAWKGLPVEEREKYSQKAKILADEQKKLYPDCWKRKRSLSSTNQPNQPANQSQSAGQSPSHHHHSHHVPSSPSYSQPGTPTGSHLAFHLPAPPPAHHYSPLSLAGHASLLAGHTPIPLNHS